MGEVPKSGQEKLANQTPETQAESVLTPEQQASARTAELNSELTAVKSLNSAAERLTADPDTDPAEATNANEQLQALDQQAEAVVKEERRQSIIKELEKIWETKNGPMDRPLSKKEIEANQYAAESHGEKWDGRTTQLTDAAKEFFFAFRGGLSVPEQADIILAQRFPEYTKTSQPDKTTSVGRSAKPESTRIDVNITPEAVAPTNEDFDITVDGKSSSQIAPEITLDGQNYALDNAETANNRPETRPDITVDGQSYELDDVA